MHRLNLDSDETLAPTYASRSFSHEIPKYRLPAEGISAEAAYRLVHDELNLDGNPALNLASFVTSWMEPQANLLAAETLAKNLIDQDEYPQTEAVHQRVVSMIGRLFHAPSGSRLDRHGDDRLLRGDHAGDARAQALLAAAARGRRRAERPAEPRDGRRRAHLLGEVRALLRRRSADRADGGGPLHDRRQAGRAAARRAHDRRRRPARHDVHGPDGRPRARSTSCSRASNPSAAGRSRCTSTPPAAAS